jgi:hypothetical protein
MIGYLIHDNHGKVEVAYRRADDGSTAERWDWASKKWVPDPRLIELLVTGADIDRVSMDEVNKAIA